VEYIDYVRAISAAHSELAARLERFVTLEHVLNWLNAERYPLAQLDMVTQDEYCHDLLIPLQNCGDWLVFGMT
jgi:hypothetical protein